MKIKKGFILRSLGDNYFVVPIGAATIDFKSLISLNDTSAFLWKQLENDVTLEELVNSFINEYEVDYSVAKADINAFIEKLKQTNVLEY